MVIFLRKKLLKSEKIVVSKLALPGSKLALQLLKIGHISVGIKS